MTKFSKIVFIESISKRAPREQSLKAKAEELKYIAEWIDVLEVKNLSADLILEHNGGSIKVSGSLKADIVQACIVSLEPVDEHVEEKFESFFTDIKPKYLELAVEEILVPDEETVPEYTEDGSIDIAELVVQHLSLAMNEYPRLEDVDKSKLIKQEEDIKKDNPFAVLKDLQD